MALLLSTSLAFAQSGVDQGGLQSQTLPRCAQVDIPIFLNHAGFDLGAWGLPLVLTGGGTIDAIAPGADQPGGLTIGTGVSGNAGVANFVGCVPAGNYPSFWVVTITTPDDCVAHLELDTAFYPPAGAWVTLDCNACPVSLSWSKGEWDLVNEDPFCGTNPDLSTEWNGSLSEQLDASDPDACDVASLSYSLVDADGLTGATVSASGLFEYTASCDDKGVHTVVFEVEDQCGATVQCDFDVTVTNAVVPSCGVNTNVSIHHSASVVDKQLNINDAVSYSLVSVVPPFNGGASVSVSASGLFNLSGTDCSDVGAHTINFRGTDGCDSIDCSFQVTITSNPPVCNVSGAHQVNWLGTLDKALTTAFVDCGPVTWSIVDEDPNPTNPGSLNGASYHFDADCADLGTTYTITVGATDATGKTDDCEFTIEVINPDPTITCPPNIPVAILGDLIEADANATDAYGDPLTFSLVSFEHLEDPGRVPHNAPSVDPSSGEFSWQTESSDNNDEGLWEVCLEVADGCGGSDQCCFTIDVLAFTLCAGDSGEVTDSIINAFNGEIVEVHVKIADGYALGGLDLLLCYDQTGLSFLGAEAEGNLAAWEYFTWRHSPQSNCPGGCPTGYVRVVAIADLDNGPTHHPDPSEFYLDGEIIVLRFQVTSDRNFIESCLLVGFCTLECGDNALSSKSGDTTFLPIGSDISCIDQGKTLPRDIINICNGRVCIQEPPDDRGDLNLNAIANEIGDAVLYTNYFINGIGVFHTDANLRAVQILASDVNDDGIVLTVADLVYLIRIITGDASPFPPGGHPRMSPYANAGTVSYSVDNSAMNVSASTPDGMGGAMFVFRYSGVAVGEPVLSSAAEGMKIRSSARNGELRVLVYPDAGSMTNVAAGTQALFSVPLEGAGRIELVENQISDADGQLLSTTAASAYRPTSYSLEQNYPNPFNAGTVIPFDLSKSGDWTLQVYNVAGQTVRSFSGYGEVGRQQVGWDGRDDNGTSVASGVYFYRVSSGDFVATRKMTLMK
jgi:hypothetical protein